MNGRMKSRSIATSEYRCEAHTCSTGRIEPGQEYVRISLVPGTELGNLDWWRVREHANHRDDAGRWVTSDAGGSVADFLDESYVLARSGRIYPAPMVRFRAKVQVADNGCHLWTGTITRKGYGMFRASGKVWAAHRWIYEQSAGPIPAGLQIDHLCRVRRCVNPEHLEPVTPKENTRRGVNYRGDFCRRGHSLADARITYSRSRNQTNRSCRTCVNDGARRKRMERAEAA